MQIVNFPKLQVGASFVVDGEAFIKRSDLIYVDSIGIETYIDPLFDAKIGKMLEKAAAAAVQITGVDSYNGPQPGENTIVVAAGAPEIQVDAQGQVVLSDTDVDRIARRVAELLKGQ